MFITTKRIFIGAAVLGVMVGIYAYARRDKEPTYDFIIAEKKDLIQEVSVTGRVKPAQEVELAFERGGKVARVNAQAGDQAEAGQILASLSNFDLTAELNRAQAGVASAKAQLWQYQAARENQQAKLDELKRGPRPEELRVYQTKVDNAMMAVTDALESMIDSVRDAYTKADDAVRNKSDQVFDFPRSSAPQLKFQTSQQTEIDLEAKRVASERNLIAWEISLASISVSGASNHRAAAKMQVDEIKAFLDLASLAVNQLNPTITLTQAAIDGWKADVAAARNNINAALANLTAAETKRRDAEAALAVADRELSLKQSGSAPEAILAQAAAVRQAEANIAYQTAQVQQAEASVQSAQAQLGQTVIRAPFAGVVTKQAAKVGAIVSANTPVITLISPTAYEIEAHVPEVDIAKLAIGNLGRVTLDAYASDVVFEVKVVAIDPAETMIDGVATYKVTFQFMAGDERIKSGLTANLDVLTEQRAGVIAVPQRAVIVRAGQKTVRILDGKTVREAVVEMGLRGSDGNIEIVSGVAEGEKVVVEFE